MVLIVLAAPGPACTGPEGDPADSGPCAATALPAGCALDGAWRGSLAAAPANDVACQQILGQPHMASSDVQWTLSSHGSVLKTGSRSVTTTSACNSCKRVFSYNDKPSSVWTLSVEAKKEQLHVTMAATGQFCSFKVSKTVCEVHACDFAWSGVLTHSAATTSPTTTTGTTGTPPTTSPFAPKQSSLCSADGFCWLRPLPQGHDLHDLWVIGPSDVWAVGDAGTRLHWDGSTWTGVSDPGFHLRGVWASGAIDVWAVGHAACSVGGGCVSGPAVAYHRGPSGAWDAVPVPDTIASLHDVWGSGPSDVWAVSATKQGGHWDGKQWLPAQMGTSPLTAIAGASASDVWAVGDSPAVAHFDGSQWSTEAFPAGWMGWNPHLLSVWTDGKEVWTSGYVTWTDSPGSAACELGFLARRKDGAWSVVAAPAAKPQDLGEGSAPCSTPLTAFAGRVDKRLGAVWGDGKGTVWAVGPSEGVRVSGGGAPTHFTPVGGLWLEDLAGVGDSLLAVGPLGALVSGKGNAWMLANAGAQKYSATSFAAAGGHVWIGGGDGGVLHFDGQQWAKQAVGSGNVTGLVARGANEVWTAAGGLFHWDGKAWTSVQLPVDTVSAVWAVPPDAIWARGPGVLVHRAGTSGVWETTNPGFGVASVAGTGPDDVWAAGGTKVARFDGKSWTPATVDLPPEVRAVWVGSAKDVWVVGDGGLARHFDGAAWTAVDSGTTKVLVSMATLDGAPLVVGGGGVARRWDGKAWLPVAVGTAADLIATVTAGDGVWLLGSRGEVLRRPAKAVSP